MPIAVESSGSRRIVSSNCKINFHAARSSTGNLKGSTGLCRKDATRKCGEENSFAGRSGSSRQSRLWKSYGQSPSVSPQRLPRLTSLLPARAGRNDRQNPDRQNPDRQNPEEIEEKRNMLMLRRARITADKAVKEGKVFLVIGPYDGLRSGLKRRGWQEKLSTAPTEPNQLFKTKHARCPATFDQLVAWVLRDVTPSLVFTVRASSAESLVSRRFQLVNHFVRANTFTTKTGLCQHLRELRWFQPANPLTFFPRCYHMAGLEERQDFVDDYNLTCCVSFLKWCVENYSNQSPVEPAEDCQLLDEVLALSECLQEEKLVAAASVGQEKEIKEEGNDDMQYDENIQENLKIQENYWQNGKEIDNGEGNMHLLKLKVENSGFGKLLKHFVVKVKANNKISDTINFDNEENRTLQQNKENVEKYELEGEEELKVVSGCQLPSPKAKRCVPSNSIRMAINSVERFLMFKSHEDIDIENKKEITCDDWKIIRRWYYECVHLNGSLLDVDDAMLEKCVQLLNQVQPYLPQHQLDGIQNVWILKPGAKSRGRGIRCLNRLEDILLFANGSWVVQKYLERPLLIEGHKFDIRQWFLVTNWSPLTLWIYKDFYIRFCSRPFTLHSFHESEHLTNNCIQKNYAVLHERSKLLPKENMWSSEQLRRYFRSEGQGEVLHDVIEPEMRRSVVSALLSAQPKVEDRKMAFELYGADFVLSDDLRPWLLEINASPTMAKSTAVMAKLADQVLEDMLKVVLDRRRDRSCDTGKFQLVFRQNGIANCQQTLDPHLTLFGRKVRK